jgi:hypothetical protein
MGLHCPSNEKTNVTDGGAKVNTANNATSAAPSATSLVILLVASLAYVSAAF